MDRSPTGPIPRCNDKRTATLWGCRSGGYLSTGEFAIIRRALAAVTHAIGLVLLLICCVWAGPSHAHALLERSSPAAGTVIATDQTPQKLSLWFTEPVQASFNSIAVLDSDNRRVDRLNARTSDQEPSRIDVDLGNLPGGAYLVRWRAVSADTHVVRGTFWFVVGFAATPPPTAQLLGTGTPTLSFTEIAVRWSSLLALLCLAGMALFRITAPATAHIAIPAWERRFTLMVLGLFLAAHCFLAATQAEAVAELPLPQALTGTVLKEVLFDSRFGALWWLKLVLGSLLGVVLYRRARATVALIVAVLLLLSTSLAGHAAGARAVPILAITADTLHLLAAALWIGTLSQLCLLLPAVVAQPSHERFETLRKLVPRVSAVLLPAVLVLVATGLVNTWEVVGTLHALFNTAHGQSLLVKLALLVPLLAIAATNLLIIRPGISAGTETAPRRFLANVRAEAVLIAALLLPVALLGVLPPSAQQTFPAPLEIARQAGDLRVAFTVNPVWVGVSRFQVELSDAQGLAPSDVRQVVLTFTMEGMNMGRTNVTMTPVGDGRYQAAGFYIGMPGIAQVGVAIDRAGAGDRTAVFRIEVPDLNAQQLAGLPAVLGISSLAGLADVPVPADAASLSLGRQLYESHCVACHGETGVGNGPAAASLLPPPADLTLHARWHSNEQLHWFITNGVAGTAMVGFADQLTSTERWDIVNHLHVLAQAPTATGARPAPVALGQLAPQSLPEEEAAPEGRLVFGPDVDNNLWVVQLPGGKPRALTQLGPKEFSSNPAWSPDGRQIAFSYYRLPDDAAIPVPDGTDLYVMQADGSKLRPLWRHEVSGTALQYPAWSADGTAVYVSRAAPGGGRTIDRVIVESGERTRILSNAAFPALSSDGRRLAYIHYPIPPDRGESLWVSAPDGSGPQQVIGPSSFEKYFSVRFSRDGRRLVFAAVGQPSGTTGSLPRARPRFFGGLFTIQRAYADGDLWDLWVVDIDGSHLRPLTALSEDLPVAAWSPDDKFIAFLGGGSASTAEAGIAIISPERKELKRLTTQPGHRGLDWTSPASAQ